MVAARTWRARRKVAQCTGAPTGCQRKQSRPPRIHHNLRAPVPGSTARHGRDTRNARLWHFQYLARLHLDPAPLRCRGLRYTDRQHAVYELGVDRLGVEVAAQAEAASEIERALLGINGSCALRQCQVAGALDQQRVALDVNAET